MATRDVDAFGEAWLNAWNRRDLDAILAHYADDIEQQSPVAAGILGDPSGRVVGKSNLREYFRKVLDAIPGDLELRILGVYQGVGTLVVHFQAKGARGAEYLELNADGRVRRAAAHILMVSDT
jgi:ketosteroid isomerase-like protein